MALRISNLLFALLFAFSVVVQANDPDPLRWMAIYGAATAACVAWDRLALPRGVAALIGGLALAWALSVTLSLHLDAPVGQALTDWQMHAGGSDELREGLGLGLVAGWMGVLGLRGPRR